MSRSYKKTPKGYYFGNESKIMKEFKKSVHKKLRSKIRKSLHEEIYGRTGDVFFPSKNIEGGDLWGAPSYGTHHWFGNSRPEDIKRRTRK